MSNHSGIRDDGSVFQIVPTSRKVMVPAAYKVIGTVGEHNAEQLTILCPKIIDGHDISGCSDKFVSWKNTLGELGTDELKILDELDGNIYFTWNIRDKLTASHGIVSFSIHFEDYAEDGTKLYGWGTTKCEECEILDSVNALVATFASVYVANGSLVFGDYTPVHDGNAVINTTMMPEGNMEITENGTYDVAKYATAEVVIPDPEPVTDPDLVPENIKKGVNIFGVEGTYDLSLETFEGGVYVHTPNTYVKVHYVSYDKDNRCIKYNTVTVDNSATITINVLKNTPITFSAYSTDFSTTHYDIKAPDDVTFLESSGNNDLSVVLPTVDKFDIRFYALAE
jgi:hypothetical protein